MRRRGAAEALLAPGRGADKAGSGRGVGKPGVPALHEEVPNTPASRNRFRARPRDIQGDAHTSLGPLDPRRLVGRVVFARTPTPVQDHVTSKSDRTQPPTELKQPERASATAREGHACAEVVNDPEKMRVMQRRITCVTLDGPDSRSTLLHSDRLIKAKGPRTRNLPIPRHELRPKLRKSCALLPSELARNRSIRLGEDGRGEDGGGVGKHVKGRRSDAGASARCPLLGGYPPEPPALGPPAMLARDLRFDTRLANAPTPSRRVGRDHAPAPAKSERPDSKREECGHDERLARGRVPEGDAIEVRVTDESIESSRD